jgi:hypothetical protein
MNFLRLLRCHPLQRLIAGRNANLNPVDLAGLHDGILSAMKFVGRRHENVPAFQGVGGVMEVPVQLPVYNVADLEGCGVPVQGQTGALCARKPVVPQHFDLRKQR